MSQQFRVIIAGDGIAGALAAAVLGMRLPKHSYRVTVVPAATTPDDCWGRVEQTLPAIRGFHADYGIDEDALIREGASFALGAAYSGWSRARPTYFLPFGDIGAPLNGVAFHQYASRLRAAGTQLSLADYSIAAMLAQSGRFGRPSNDPRNPLSSYTYGLHVDVRSYTGHLLAMARGRGVGFAGSPVAGAELAQDGSLAGVRVASGEIIAGDFFIDATGSRAQLLSALPGYERLSWRRWFQSDRSVELLTRAPRPPAPYSHVTLESDGWTRVVPAGGVISELKLYSSTQLQPDRAQASPGAATLGAPVGTPVHRDFECGRAASPWLRNCLALGSAAAVIEPTAATALHLIHSGLERLLPLFPRSKDCPIEARGYTNPQILESDRCRDFALLPHRLSGRLAEGPAELETKIELFRGRGQIPMLDGDIFEEQDWAAVFDGHAFAQKRYSLLADTLSLRSLREQLSRMRQLMLDAVAGLPTHAETLDRIRRKAAA